MIGDHDAGCSCCTGRNDQTPLPLANRPGLGTIAYRAGTYGSFLASMLAGLSRSSRPDLAALRTREPDDLSIALIDAWAVAADVLTFSTERIANEHYLGTATERRSVAEMAALLGYRLGPGVAAQAWLAFMLETSPGAPAESLIAAGSRTQTLPGPGEVPQTFETLEPLLAVAAWNQPALLLSEARTPQTGDDSVLLNGIALNLKPGDQLLFVAANRSVTTGAGRWAAVRVTNVSSNPGRDQTTVTFSPALSGLDVTAGQGVSVYALRNQAALFGFNASDPRLLDPRVKDPLKGGALNTAGDEWTFAAVSGQEIMLDGLYEGIEPGSWAVLQSGDNLALGKITGVRETATSAYGLSGRVSVLKLDLTDADLTAFAGAATRATIVRFRSEAFSLADTPIRKPLYGSKIPLREALPANAEPRRILVRGKRPRAALATNAEQPLWPLDTTPLVLAIDDDLEGLPGDVRWRLRPETGEDFDFSGPADAVIYLPARDTDDVVGEVVMVQATPGPEPTMELQLIEPLLNVYDRQGATPIELYGNVAGASQGETVAREILGSGDGSKPFQHFTLRKPPLTYLPDPTAAGAGSTLELRVNGIRWHEAATLYGARPRDRVYVSTVGDDGTTTVTFGDGEQGARLPTGNDNVVATYRCGLGLAGMARAEQITLAMTRPLGLKSVTNPLAAGGAQDPQHRDDVRRNAPRSVLTLGRVVSLQDYADFASGYAGVGRATATWTWDGSRRGILLTVAAADGKPVPDGVPLLATLTSGLLAAGNSRVPLEVRDFRPARFRLLARLRIGEDHEAEVTRLAVATALQTQFSGANRSFGQGVSLSEVVESIHSVAGVAGVKVERLHRETDQVSVAAFLVAQAPRPGGLPTALGAEILSLAPDGVTVEVGW